ncbi:Uu.00g134770.m01.CDS01 [Anthostomella pinea]|uniref:Uu.00g134770.m01.CDS01 n=1 Tax=Anthostomella pinea TaxID=933095 RepID=A0AAI8VP11_9PEZI|nr:Uu.00g134770.m01.CDS01 [Anthostomella pinea]
MFKIVYNTFAVAASIVLLWLSYTGPPPPIAKHVYLPDLQTRPTFLLGNLSYRHFDAEADALWGELVPSNGGAVLGTNITNGFHVWAVPAMFHQLKCLRDIRTEFIAIGRSGREARRFMSERGQGSDYEKVAYCFDYIRQSILCHADTTLHPVAQLTPETKIIDGNALWHQCRDSSVLYDWAYKSGVPHKDYLLRENPIVA